MEEVTPLQQFFLESRLKSKRVEHYLTVNAIAAAIFDVGRQLSGGQGGSYTKAMQALKNQLFPEISQELERSVADVQKVLEQEAEVGPIQVQRLDYESRRSQRKKRR